jgi:hypothetical protein
MVDLHQWSENHHGFLKFLKHVRTMVQKNNGDKKIVVLSLLLYLYGFMASTHQSSEQIASPREISVTVRPSKCLPLLTKDNWQNWNWNQKNETLNDFFVRFSTAIPGNYNNTLLLLLAELMDIDND